MRGALVRGLAGRMQRKAEEHEASHAGQRRPPAPASHASAEGLAAGEQRQSRRSARRLRHRGADGACATAGESGARAARSMYGNW